MPFNDYIASHAGRMICQIATLEAANEELNTLILASYKLLAQCLKEDTLSEAMKIQIQANTSFAAWSKNQ